VKLQDRNFQHSNHLIKGKQLKKILLQFEKKQQNSKHKGPLKMRGL